MRQLGIYQLPPGFKLSVVMPVYNEQATIHEILHRVRAVPIPKEIVIVDDCSTDGTRELLRALGSEPDVHIVYHARNGGKGAALQTAFTQVTGDVVIIQDADLEYHPSAYRRLIQPICTGGCLVGGREHRYLTTEKRKLLRPSSRRRFWRGIGHSSGESLTAAVVQA